MIERQRRTSRRSGRPDAGTRPTSCLLQLNADFGGFGSGDIMPGTYALAGDDIDYGLVRSLLLRLAEAIDVTGTSLSAVTMQYLMTETYMAVSGRSP